jgi:hypothetical protein
VTVSTLPNVDVQPLSQQVCVSTPATFSISASGTGVLTYQWYRNGFVIPGAVLPTFTIPITVVGDSATYNCSVTNACGTVSSISVVLTVQPLWVYYVTPLSVPVGSGPTEITIIGVCFLEGSTVYANGQLVPSTWIDQATMTATVPAAMLAEEGGVAVNVVNPSNVISTTGELVVGSGQNLGTVIVTPFNATPGMPIQVRVEGGLAGSPVAIFVDPFNPAPFFFPTPGAQVLGIGTAGLFLLADAFGLPLINLSPALTPILDVNGRFFLPFTLPAPGFNMQVTLQAMYLDPTAPFNLRFTWAYYPVTI